MTTISPADGPTAPTFTACDPAGPDDPTITPSELIWLGAEVLFGPIPSIAFGKHVALSEGRDRVSLERFVRMAFAAALFEAERAGAVRLVRSSTSKWFGLRRAPSLTVEPAPRSVEWPAGSLEADVAAVLADRGPLTVSDLVFHFLREDSPIVRQGIADRIAAGLADRGYVREIQDGDDDTAAHADAGDADEEVRTWRLTEDTQAALSSTLVDPLSDLWGRLNEVHDDRPAVWKLLAEGVDDGIGRRREARPDFYTANRHMFD